MFCKFSITLSILSGILLCNALPASSEQNQDKAFLWFQRCIKSQKISGSKRVVLDTLGISAVSPKGYVSTTTDEGDPLFMDQYHFSQIKCGRKTKELFGINPLRGSGSSNISFTVGMCDRFRYKKLSTINVLGKSVDVGTNMSSVVIDVETENGTKFCLSGFDESEDRVINVAESIRMLKD